MTYWENDSGDIFETEEDARIDADEQITREDFEKYFTSIMGFHDFFMKCYSFDDFFKQFNDECIAVEKQFFRDNYHEIVDNKEDE